jgi:TonB family protein
VLLSGVFLVTAPAIQASATPSQDIILGALPKAAIQAGVLAGAPAFQGCLEPGQAGTVAVRFTIRADGSVGNPSIKESTMQSAPMEQCLLEQLETLQFPAPEGGGIVMVRYPLRFSAS